MKTIPCLFVRMYDDGGCLGVVNEIMPGCEWVAKGEGIATEKVDGAPCAIIGGVLYKRFIAHYGKPIPDGAIPCQPSVDKVTGKWPHWFPVDSRAASDRWMVRALLYTPWATEDGTYEAVGKHFKGNPYKLDDDFLEPHGRIKHPDCPRDYAGIREYLRTHDIEGIVWHRGNGDMCTISRKDFNFDWPVKRGTQCTSE